MRKITAVAVALATWQSFAQAALVVDNASTSTNVSNSSTNLTSEAAANGGPGDWIRWLEVGSNFTAASSSSFDHSSTGGSRISTYSLPTGNALQIVNSPGDTDGNTFSWTDGTTYTSSGTAIGNNGYVFNDPTTTTDADKFTFTVTNIGSGGTGKVWLANFDTNLTLTVGGFNSGNVLQSTGTGSWNNAGVTASAAVAVFSYNYSGAISGDYLKFTLSNAGGAVYPNVGLYAASVATVPEPSTYALFGLGLGAWALTRFRRFRPSPRNS